jgi:branched-chain amino acid transport system ATP-binding protein
LLKVSGVSAGYGNLQILNGVSIEAKPNQITVIVGPNGSGKSTLLKTIAGLTNIYQGEVTLDGKKISDLPPHEIARLGIAYLPQRESTFTHLNVAENFKMAGYTVSREDFEERVRQALALFPKLSLYMKTRVSNLSGGERQMVAMSMALLRKPNTIMFDEPTANLAPILATQVLNAISYLSQTSGITILLVEQHAIRALEIGQYAYLLVSGQTIFQGPTKELLEHKELGRLYLGLNVSQRLGPGTPGDDFKQGASKLEVHSWNCKNCGGPNLNRVDCRWCGTIND